MVRRFQTFILGSEHSGKVRMTALCRRRSTYYRLFHHARMNRHSPYCGQMPNGSRPLVHDLVDQPIGLCVITRHKVIAIRITRNALHWLSGVMGEQ